MWSMAYLLLFPVKAEMNVKQYSCLHLGSVYGKPWTSETPVLANLSALISLVLNEIYSFPTSFKDFLLHIKNISILGD